MRQFFLKQYLKLINGELTLVMPNEIEKLVAELPRDTENRYAF
jgi:hypothetical protein